MVPFLLFYSKGGMIVTTEAIRKILEKERQIEDETSKARKIIADRIEKAKNEAEVKRKQIIANAGKKSEELVAKVQLDIDKMYDDAKDEADKRKEKIFSKSSDLENKAAKIVCEVLF